MSGHSPSNATVLAVPKLPIVYGRFPQDTTRKTTTKRDSSLLLSD